MSPTSSSNALSLSDLGAFDPKVADISLGQGGERRCLCPFCGHSKPRDAAHRSLSLNTSTGLWRCHRCDESGQVRDAWERHSPLPRRQRARAGLAQAFALPPTTTRPPAEIAATAFTAASVAAFPVASSAASTVTSTAAPAAAFPVVSSAAAASDVALTAAPATALVDAAGVAVESWKRDLRGLCPLGGTRAAAYLSGRGLSAADASAAGARFSPSFMGRAAIVFPLRDQAGVLRGAHARYLDGRSCPKARTVGDKRASLFATAGAFLPVMPALIVTEAPLDALSLAHASYPALAVCGTEPPVWFHRLCAFRRVLLAFDADDAGERAADKLAPVLESFGARCERLAPDADLGGAKDWNEALQTQGRDALADWLAARVLVE